MLLISIDSLRADHLGCYGYERDTSPVLDRLASEGVRFQTVLSPSSWTLPAHATMFTGLPPEGHGLRFDAKALTADAHCLAEVFQEEGYATAAFVGGPFLRSLYGFDQGFDVYDDQTVVRSFRESQSGATSPALVGLTTAWLDEQLTASPDEPFFVFLHLWDVHFDYTPPAPYDTLFDPDYSGNISATNFELGKHIHRDMDPADLEHIVALYDGEIRFTDSWVGRLLEHLESLGQLDNTIIAVTADHGEEFFDHGTKGHRKNLFDESLLVPLIIRYPAAVDAAQVVDAPAQLMDLPLTLTSLAGVPLPAQFAAPDAPSAMAPRDLSALLKGTAPSSAAGQAGALEGAGDRVLFGDLHGAWAFARRSEHKLLRTPKGRLREHLFHLASDPLEQEDVTGFSEERQELRALLDEWKAYWSRRKPPCQDIQLSDEQQATLRALGYIR